MGLRGVLWLLEGRGDPGREGGQPGGRHRVDQAGFGVVSLSTCNKDAALPGRLAQSASSFGKVMYTLLPIEADNQQGPAAQHRGLCSTLGASLGGRSLAACTPARLAVPGLLAGPTATSLTAVLQDEIRSLNFGVEAPQPFVLVIPAAATFRYFGFKSKLSEPVAHCLFASSLPTSP